MDEALIQIVDEHDNPTGKAIKEEMWRKGLWHRVVRIMAFDKNGRVLLQKRAPTKQPFPGCWDNSAAGHVDAGEDYDTAAKRELQEELGLSGIPLTKIADYSTNGQFGWRRMNRFVRLYKIQLDELPTNLEHHAITEVRWFMPDQLKMLVREHPEQVSDGLKEVVEKGLVT